MQERLEQKGQEIFARIQSYGKGSLFDKVYGGILKKTMEDEPFKVQMFRFIDVLPSLNSNKEFQEHLQEYFVKAQKDSKKSMLFKGFQQATKLGAVVPGVTGMVNHALHKQIMSMASQFIVSDKISELVKSILRVRKQHIAFSVDLLGEVTLSESEALSYQNRYLELIEQLTQKCKEWPMDPQIDRDGSGEPVPRVNISVKLSSLYSQIHPAAWEKSVHKLKERLRPLFRLAMSKGAFINLDMEHYDLKDLTLDVFKGLLMEKEFLGYSHFGCVIQAYLRDSLKDVRELIKFARRRGTPFTVRLVKGAYWDYEVVEAEQRSWPIPVYTYKPDTDINFEECCQLLLRAHEHLSMAVASHNVRSLALALCIAEDCKLGASGFELQMIYGMADPIKRALKDMGYRVREYIPMGELIPGMAYLVRRLLENTSNESFLRYKFAEDIDDIELLKDPKTLAVQQKEKKPQKLDALSAEKGPFVNQALVDFRQASNRDQMQAALVEVRKRILGKSYPLLVGGEKVYTDRKISSVNPSRPDELVGTVAVAEKDHVQRALTVATRSFPSWARTEVKIRCDVVLQLADLMEEETFSLMALQVFEIGKTWKEAAGELAEAIDFCRYYAQQMRLISQGRKMGNVPGEMSLYSYQPRGPTVVIAPWNFPLAILCGMTVAPLLTGNTVVVKPAEQSSVIASHFVRLLYKAGCPPEVVQLLTGYGEEAGALLVEHPKVSNIAFTGSKEVGLQIFQKASHTPDGQMYLKRCLIEMGGKNAIIVDSDADLDEAVSGVLHSAFGFQGQKCSAASRILVLKSIYEKFQHRFMEAVQSIDIGFSEDPGTFIGPVIDEQAQRKLLKVIAKAQREGISVLFQGHKVPETGYFVPPTVFTKVQPKSFLAQEELFGPIVSLIEVENIKEALAVANNTSYALTGGIFSRQPGHIALVKREFQVGNLYINRGITHAMVERHPFGGFKMSGIGSKAGGPDYLKNFMEPRCVTENTLRRGFAPSQKVQEEL